ncbi:RNA-directed DNA polymerase [Micromonospora sp. RHAY321]|uniref:RNA-directed DNA polymerase n=1 Tax=Micromonospora sp. RHAY321 TaxID=2944807 RepID=UPI00207CC2AF|nr:RNA-directed DNA polymerase [Micromonospora sp. RHAY321]MCO1597652.1 RNA-directed DNA polymerase [Micromonospora sp. RHAY321]
MRPLPADVIAQLDLSAAARWEAMASEALMPSSPGGPELQENAPVFAAWLTGQLQAGLTTSSGLVIGVAKPENGSRPVAIWGFPERVTYRAMTDLLMAKARYEVDRSNGAYQAFSVAPIRFAETRATRAAIKAGNWTYQFRPEDAGVQYLVTADLASFYDYIDHDILGRELLLRTSDHATIECLLELLLEVQGRRYGIPQLLEPSDRLSELYASRIHRALQRQQWPSWRYNDDFRIAVESFQDAKRALDDLTSAARDNGLVLNESKTRTPSFVTYYRDYNVADYDDGSDDRDPTWALNTLRSTVTPRELDGQPASDTQIGLHEVDRSAIRTIRQALTNLAVSGEPRAVEVMPKMENIVAFVAAATPYVLRYLRAMASIDRPATTRSLGAIINDVSLSDWQRLCILRAIRELHLTDSEPFTAWVTGHRTQRYGSAVRAEATLALADVNRIETQDVVRALDEEPSALATWYLQALQRLRRHDAIADETYEAIRDDGGLHMTILGRS